MKPLDGTLEGRGRRAVTELLHVQTQKPEGRPRPPGPTALAALCPPPPAPRPAPAPPSACPDTHVWVVTADHLPVGHLVAQAVRGLVRVHGHVQHVRGVHGQDGVGELGPARRQQHEQQTAGDVSPHGARRGPGQRCREAERPRENRSPPSTGIVSTASQGHPILAPPPGQSLLLGLPPLPQVDPPQPSGGPLHYHLSADSR